MKRLGLIISILISSIFYSSAQNEGNIWYFGASAGLDFNSGVPIALTDGQLNTGEGCSSIADNNGDLLFYTDGMTAYNKNHTIMPNGSGLLGNSSSTQSGIIVKKPGSLTIYYLFTCDGISGNSGGLNYSEVDMTLNGGLGDINANKNILIISGSDEKITAVTHQNGIDFWIVFRLINSNTYHSYLLTSTGLNLNPIVTNIGPTYFGEIGYLKASPDGTKIANANWISSTFEMFDFDNNTGLLSNPLTGYVASPYGIEFSLNSNLLYVGEYYSRNINQYNLLAGSNAAIMSSVLSIGQSTLGDIGALQLGPDGKIYLAIVSAGNLAVIDSPDILGLGCNFNVNGPQLAGSLAINGLPTFFSSIFNSTTNFSFNNPCYGDSSFFNFNSTSFDSILWNFGDPNSGIENNSTDLNPFHIFTDTGTFHINLYSYFNGIADTATNDLFVTDLPTVNLGNDTVICDGEILTLDATVQNATYLWQDNSTNSTYDVINVGNYSVIITDSNGCINSDTIHVFLNPLPYIDLGNDIEICEGDVLTLDVYLEGASYLWSDNSTISSGDIDATGFYSVILTDSNGCSNSDTINVIINPLPNSDFTFNPQPTDLNNPNILFSNISSANTSYEWNLGDGTIIENLNNINHIYLFSGEYDVSLISLNEFDCIDTVIYQIIIDPGGLDLFIPNAFTPNNDQHNELFVIKGRYIIDFNIKIFNHWGKKIFESDNIEKHWDGRFQGKLVQQEKYTYLVTVLDINADIHEFPGIVYLIH
tara:strand:+ start:405 stop:2684 length:2280 start_codon:yes stop_codon:yes gene_type:complete